MFRNIKIKLHWIILDTKYWIDVKLCPITKIEDGICIFKFPKLHAWLSKDFPDAW